MIDKDYLSQDISLKNKTPPNPEINSGQALHKDEELWSKILFRVFGISLLLINP